MAIPPPLVSSVEPGSLAERSGAIAAGQRLLAVNGVGVHGHVHGSRLLKLASGKIVLRLSLARGRDYSGGHVPRASNRVVLSVRSHLKVRIRRRALRTLRQQRSHSSADE